MVGSHLLLCWRYRSDFQYIPQTSQTGQEPLSWIGSPLKPSTFGYFLDGFDGFGGHGSRMHGTDKLYAIGCVSRLSWVSTMALLWIPNLPTQITHLGIWIPKIAGFLRHEKLFKRSFWGDNTKGDSPLHPGWNQVKNQNPWCFCLCAHQNYKECFVVSWGPWNRSIYVRACQCKCMTQTWMTLYITHKRCIWIRHQAMGSVDSLEIFKEVINIHKWCTSPTTQNIAGSAPTRSPELTPAAWLWINWIRDMRLWV